MSTKAANGRRYRSSSPRTSNGIPGSGPIFVSPRPPRITFRTPTRGGRRPSMRSTFQLPSSSDITSPLSRARRRQTPKRSSEWRSLPAMPGASVPFPPMEAELVAELPPADGWQYEPKWDGFRGVLENDGGELALWSRNERPLLRYFPELRPLGDLLPPHSALDGVIAKRLGLPYLPGSRDGVLKVKPFKTADCVIVGVRWKEKPTRIATLLLGLYNDEGKM